MFPPKTLNLFFWCCIAALGGCAAMLVGVYVCGTASEVNKVQAWTVTIGIALATLNLWRKRRQRMGK